MTRWSGRALFPGQTAPGPLLSTWSRRQTAVGGPAAITAGLTSSPSRMHTPCPT
ncbi:MAG: hypothetical protein ACK56I_32835 [bacterium]